MISNSIPYTSGLIALSFLAHHAISTSRLRFGVQYLYGMRLIPSCQYLCQTLLHRHSPWMPSLKSCSSSLSCSADLQRGSELISALSYFRPGAHRYICTCPVDASVHAINTVLGSASLPSRKSVAIDIAPSIGHQPVPAAVLSKNRSS
jgi:hypothetical protein